MEYMKVSDTATYKSWVQLELEANRILGALQDYTYSIVVSEEEPIANNVLFFKVQNQ